MHVKELLFRQLIAVGNQCVDLAHDFICRFAVSVIGFEQGSCFLCREYQRLTHEVVLGSARCAKQERPTLEGGKRFDKRCQRTADRRGNELFEFAHLAGVIVPVIACEQLIRTLARQHNRDMLACQLCKEIQRYGGRIGLRLVHVVLDIGKRRKAFVGCQNLFVVLNPEQIGQFLCKVRFVKELAALRIKADRERLIGHQGCCDIAGIDAAREECTDADIGNAVCRNGFVDRAVDILDKFIKRLVLARKDGIPIRVGGQSAVLVNIIVRRCQLFHAGKERILTRGILERQIRTERVCIDRLFKRRMVKKALDLRAE